MKIISTGEGVIDAFEAFEAVKKWGGVLYMKKSKLLGAVVLSLALVLGGFAAGRYVKADVESQPEPGSVMDPLVTQSYVDSQLKAQVEALKAQIAALESRVASLEARLAAVPAAPGAGTEESAGQGGTSPGSTTPSVKKVYPKKDVSKANVRSGPGTNFAIVGKIEAKSPGIFVSERNGWYLVKLPSGKSGWVSKTVVDLR